MTDTDTGKTYIAIDLKSFYASVECQERGLDPLTTNLVVADESRTEKTICLAVSPSLKSYGISGRARLFEAVQRVKEVNAERLHNAPGKKFSGSSYNNTELQNDPSLKLDFIIAKPRMARYMEVSTNVFRTYLKYVSSDDIHVYSVDEVFIDATDYLKMYSISAHDFAMKMIRDVLANTGITATAGIGTNMYLCKIAMDVVAKKMPADKDGVRIAYLDERSYREQIWGHKPITDLWRIGRGYARRLARYGMYTMGDVARCSLGKKNDYLNEDLLYRLFGVNAELLIDHAWGYESCTIADIKSYVPRNNSLSSGQVLAEPYTFEKARIVCREMADSLVLDMVDKGLVCDQMVLTVGYDISNLTDETRSKEYKGQYSTDFYGRIIPREAHGSKNAGEFTSSGKILTGLVMQLFDENVDRKLLVRRMYVVANHVKPESAEEENKEEYEQLDLFTDYEALERERTAKKEEREREKRRQQAVLQIKKKYGKNAILKGTDLQEGATAIERNSQVGGHRA